MIFNVSFRLSHRNISDMGKFPILFCFRSNEPPKKRLKQIISINFEVIHCSNLVNLSVSRVCVPAFAESFSNNELPPPNLLANSLCEERAEKLLK